MSNRHDTHADTASDAVSASCASSSPVSALESIDEVVERLASFGYIAERDLATAIFLALRLGRPLFLEGEAGVGKTEVAKVLARLLDTRLLRLQCYEGLDLAQAAYEWDVQRQLLHIRLLEATGDVDPDAARRDLYRRDFLLARPLLAALESYQGRPPVLLIDELDRADDAFEAFLLEILSDFQLTVPELGTVRAEQPPVVIVTSNRTREVHDALRRRCLYCWVEHPPFDKELRIVRAKVPGLAEHLSREIVAFVQTLRREELYKKPGVAETLDWARALEALDCAVLVPEIVEATLGALLKYQDDMAEVRSRGGVETLVAEARQSAESEVPTK